MTKTELRSHLLYSAWASRRALESCAGASSEALRGALEKLQHVFFADRVWLSRVNGVPRAQFSDPGESYDLPALGAAWEVLHAEWLAFAESADPDRRTTYRTFSGAELENSVSQIVLHVVNHASYHRGQVAAILRQAGVAPLSTDLLEYTRGL